MSVNAIPLFQPGGALRADAFYIERPADTELLRALLGGEFCYVLAPRQIGKSSLRARTQARLQTAGVRCAVLDLTTIGTTASEHEWYSSLLGEMADMITTGQRVLPTQAQALGYSFAFASSAQAIRALLGR
jgi:hypothetical protein